MIGSVPVDRLPEFTTGAVTKRALAEKLDAVNVDAGNSSAE